MILAEALDRIIDTIIQLFVIFPYSAVTIPRQRALLPPIGLESVKSKDAMQAEQKSDVLSDRVFKLCTSPESVSSLLSQNPSLEPGEAWKKLYGHHVLKSAGATTRNGHDDVTLPDDELDRAKKCGKWGKAEPSELFLQIYHDALCTLDENPSYAMVSPSLMGSSGVVPLTVISAIPDIVRHMSNLIVRAEHEVFLATNYWQDSTASKFLTNAIRELDRRAGKRGQKVVMKIIYDRGSAKQVIEPHYLVSEKEYTGKNVSLPPAADIPNIDLQVMNYHQPLLGTFHAKYMLVDRKIAVLQSNNIQDNDNLEMMLHLEGPIVDSMYDVALLSWHKQLTPPLPSHNSPAAQSSIVSFGERHRQLFEENGALKGHSVVIDPSHISWKHAYGQMNGSSNGQGPQPGVPGPSTPVQNSDNEHQNVTAIPSTAEEVLPSAETSESNGQEQPMGKQERYRSTRTNTGAPAESTEDFLLRGRQSLPQGRITGRASSLTRLPEHTADDPHYDDDIAGEVERVQNAVAEKPGETRMQAVTRLLNHTTNDKFQGNAPECPPEEEMTPYIPHPAHEPFPMALVNRSPYGPPNHKSVATPQNAAWLSALRNAKKNVFIQSPTLNAEPLIPAIRDACERGIDVYCYICLGYNDMGELLPMQGGHNEMVAHDLYASLSPAGRQRLHYFWYCAKDQTQPISQIRKKRSCHIKLMIVDEHIGIQGNGNQDTQSWFHSQEINVMLDSEHICRAWIDGLRRNQNTHVYGALDRETGIWTDAEGQQADGAMGIDPGRFSWAKGLVAAVKRVRGVGGF